ncbi:hypothetical protein CAJ82_23200 [Salmonella enterica subsp. enterica serovar Typhi]|nr:hypothetical protein [Salmonella enterica subsp. enterica serovar Typhi]
MKGLVKAAIAVAVAFGLVGCAGGNVNKSSLRSAMVNDINNLAATVKEANNLWQLKDGEKATTCEALGGKIAVTYCKLLVQEKLLNEQGLYSTGAKVGVDAAGLAMKMNAATVTLAEAAADVNAAAKINEASYINKIAENGCYIELTNGMFKNADFSAFGVGDLVDMATSACTDAATGIATGGKIDATMIVNKQFVKITMINNQKLVRDKLTILYAAVMEGVKIGNGYQQVKPTAEQLQTVYLRKDNRD